MFAFFVMVMLVFLFFLQRDLPSAHDIGFRHQLGVEHQVHRQRVLRLRFKQFHIDLTGSGFVPVDDRRSAFAYLNTAHPRTGNILQPEVLRQSAYGRRVLLD